MLALIATGLIPLILCIISGILLNRYRFIPHETWLFIDKLNYYFLFPALLFSSLSGADIGLGCLKAACSPHSPSSACCLWWFICANFFLKSMKKI